MVIYGKLEEVRKQFAGHAGITKALDYLAALGPDVKLGEQGGAALKIEIEGDALFALHQSYIAKPEAEARFEAHRRYIDVQYIVSGEELMLAAPLENQPEAVPYDDAKDLAFYLADPTRASRLIIPAGSVAIFYPEDLHAPSLAIGEPNPVGKVVLKVKDLG